jgi:hypothetical protein
MAPSPDIDYPPAHIVLCPILEEELETNAADHALAQSNTSLVIGSAFAER